MITFNKNKQKDKQESPLITMHSYTHPEIEKEIKKLEDKLPKEAEKAGKKLGLVGRPLPDDNILPVEYSYLQEAQAVNEIIKSEITGHVLSTFQKVKDKQKEIERLGIDSDDRVEKEIEKATAAKDNSLTDLKSLFEGKIKRAKEQVKHWNEVLTNAQHQTALIAKEAKNAFSLWVYLALLGLIGIGEFPLTYQLFLSLGNDLIATIAISIGLTAALIIIAHYYGLFLKQYFAENKKRGILVSIGVNSIVIAVFVGVGVMRATAEGGNSSLMLFGLINCLVFWCGVAISYFYHPKDKEAAQELSRLKTENKNSLKELQKAEAKEEEIQKTYDTEQERIMDEYRERIEKAESSEHPLIEELNNLKASFHAIWAYGQAKENQVSAIKDKALQTFRTANYLSRKDKTPIAYWEEDLPALKKHFQNFADFFNANQGNLTESNTQSTFTPPKRNLGLTMILALAMFATACSPTKSEPVRSKIVVGIDITDSITQPIHEVSTHLLEQFEANEAEIYNAEIFLLSDVSNNHSYTATWEYGSVIENPDKRDARKLVFVDELDSLFKEALSHPQGREYSRIYYPICRALYALANSKAQFKCLVLFTDLLENDPEVFSIYAPYGQKQLVKHPEVVKAAFENECQLPSLEGINIKVIHRNVRETDRMVWLMQGFYQELLEAKGASVSYHANFK